jgi:ankyrin repeat protein
MTAASSSIPSKRCVVCGKDLSQAKRTKVPSGEYYCERCYAARSSVGKPPSQAAAATAPGSGRTKFLLVAGGLVAAMGIAAAAYLIFASPSVRTVSISQPAQPQSATPSATQRAPRIRGGDINAWNSHGRTALNLAAAGGHRDEVESLLAKGADINAKDDDGATPLHGAVRRGHRDLAEFLLSKKADIEAKNNRGQTPLHLAAADGHQEMAEMLLSKGANINAKDNDGLTPLAKARRRRHPQLATFLREHGGTE